MKTFSPLLLIPLAWCLGACAGTNVATESAHFDQAVALSGAGASSAATSEGLYFGSENSSLDARRSDDLPSSYSGSLDGMTGGLQTNSARGLDDGSPTAGAFFGNGGDGDVRARTESFFKHTLGSTLTTSSEGPPAESPGEAPTDSLAASRKMIHQGRLALEVPRVDETMDGLQQRAEDLGGFMALRSGNRMVLRVPRDAFHDFFDEVKGMGRILDEELQAQDVTEEYTDLAIRLENLKETRTRLLALLDKAQEMKDVLQIERELSWLTGEIERMTGRLKVLDDRIALSTLTVALSETPQAEDDTVRGRPSRFPWIRMVGVEHVWNRF